jgi:demethylmenaquinone methyltransferase/2-methoxy-6-polyprenyl-1,4-benzoquinol methylase
MPLPASVETWAPHSALNDYYATTAGKRKFVDQAFHRAAGSYDLVESIMALGTGRWYRRQALRRAGLVQGMRVLDVAVGTGLVAREAIGLIGSHDLILGLDPSAAMMQQAIQSLDIRGILGVGEQLPLADEQFDFVSMGYALRHLMDVQATFNQFARVLRPGGRICILEISSPKNRASRALLRGYMRYIIPVLTRIATGSVDSQLLWQYYWDTIEACVRPETILDYLRRCGFQDVRYHAELGLFSEYTAVRPAVLPDHRASA